MSTLPTDDGIERLFRDIKDSVNRIPLAVAGRSGPFALFNQDGSKPPLFWCFNNWVEAVFFANRLDPDQPLVAMRSFYGFLKGKQNKRANIQDVARKYVTLMQDRLADGPIIIGGNCQAAPIAEAIAHHLLATMGRKALLITLEHVPFYSYPGDILMLFGADSEQFNPFVQGHDPVPGWQAMHDTPAWGFVTAEHGQYFVEPGVDLLAALVQDATGAFCRDGRISSGEYMLACPQATQQDTGTLG